MFTWKTYNKTSHLEQPDRFHLRYAERMLVPDDTLQSVYDTKQEIFGNAVQATDGLYVLHICDSGCSMRQINPDTCFCFSENSDCAPDTGRLMTKRLRRADGSEPKATSRRGEYGVEYMSMYMVPKIRGGISIPNR